MSSLLLFFPRYQIGTVIKLASPPSPISTSPSSRLGAMVLLLHRPTIHKGLLEVPQSKQVLFWPSSDEPSFGFLMFMSSDSVPSTGTQIDPVSNYSNQEQYFYLKRWD